MLSTHYRQPLDWTLRGLESAWHALDDLFWAAADTTSHEPSPGVLAALDDDLNTPQAIAELHAMRKRVNKLGEGEPALQLGASLNFLGLDGRSFRKWLDLEGKRVVSEAGDIEALIGARNAARKAKNFKEADRIRDELAAMGIQLKDAKDPSTGEIVTTWEVKR
jgi:cysteinyl-tRNA synthetase